jgi:hypothetical protein
MRSSEDSLCEAPFMQIPNIEEEFVLATDANSKKIHATWHQIMNGELPPLSY